MTLALWSVARECARCKCEFCNEEDPFPLVDAVDMTAHRVYLYSARWRKLLGEMHDLVDNCPFYSNINKHSFLFHQLWFTDFIKQVPFASFEEVDRGTLTVILLRAVRKLMLIRPLSFKD